MVRPYAEIDPGIGCEQLAVERRHHGKAQRIRAADRQKIAVITVSDRHGLFPERGPALRNGDKLFPFRSQFDRFMAFAPHDQFKAQFIFQRTEPVADGGLGEEQKLGGPGNAPGGDDGQKGFNFGKCHGEPPRDLHHTVYILTQFI